MDRGGLVVPVDHIGVLPLGVDVRHLGHEGHHEHDHARGFLDDLGLDDLHLGLAGGAAGAEPVLGPAVADQAEPAVRFESAGNHQHAHADGQPQDVEPLLAVAQERHGRFELVEEVTSVQGRLVDHVGDGWVHPVVLHSWL